MLVIAAQVSLFGQEPVTYSSESNSSSKLFSGINDFRTWSIGVHLGSLVPVSAFGGRNDFSNWESNFGYGFNVKKQVSHIFGIQADFLGGKLSANNDKSWAGTNPISPYKSFKTDLNWSASLNVVATFANINWSQLRTWIKPYASVGVGSVNFTPHLVNSLGTSIDYQSGDNISNLFIPLGFGMKTHLSQTLNLDLGYTVGFYDGDNLDGYMKEPFVSDRFSYGHIGVEFVIGKKSKPQLARHNAPRQLSKEMTDMDLSIRRELASILDKNGDRTTDIKSLKEDFVRMKKDTDGDGVSDYFDKCAGTPQGIKVDGSGCPLPEHLPRITETVVKTGINQEDLNVMAEASSNLQFETGKAILKPVSYQYLHRVVDILIKKGLNIKLSGYTDNIGSEAANLKLSKARAETVKNFLLKQGVTIDHIEANGYGEEYPIASNKTAAGRLKNRRVEFTIY